MRKLVLAILLALPLAAQNIDIESLSGLQFNFGNPGARSLGMGGAFLGLADDASAAEANPAGLTILRKPEVSIEARNYLEQQLFTTSGTYPNVERTAFTHHSDRVVLTFASFVYPIAKKFTIGGYYHEPLNNQGGGIVVGRYDEITGDFTPVPNFYLPVDNNQFGAPITSQECTDRRRNTNNPFSCLEFRIDPFVSALQVRQRTYGLAGTWQLHPKFSVGATVRHQRLLEGAFTSRYTQQLDPKAVIVQATARVKDGDVELAEESDTTFTAGFKWQPHEKVSVGGVYKQGPEFETALFFADTTSKFNFSHVGTTSFHIPDVAGLGVSVRPIPTLTINADAVRVTYSNLVDDFVSINGAVQALGGSPFQANDVTELHVGAEYFFTTKIPVALRAGYWRDPKHSVEWTGPLNHPQFIALSMLYPEGEDQNHMSIGGGLAFSRFQIDAAYDTSKHYKVGSISLVTRF